MEGFILSTLGQYVVTELIKAVINCSRVAVKCKSECRKLHHELVLIKPDVEKIEKRVATLRNSIPRDAHEDLQMVDDWLRRLKEAIESAQTDVHRCNSGRFSLDQHKLSVRLTNSYNTITNLAQQRQTLFLHLRTLMHVPSPGAFHPPQSWHETPGESVLRRMADERNDALRREDFHRHTINACSSLHYACGHGGGTDWSGHGGGTDSSGHGGGTDSSGHGGGTDSSGHGMDYSGSLHFQQVSPQSDVIFQEQHRQDEAECEFTRRRTMATAYGHDHEPAYDKWKY